MAALVAGHAGTVNAGQPVGIDLEVTDRSITEVRGWGLMPAPFDRQLPAYADGSPAHGDAGWLPNTGSEPNAIHRAVGSLGFDIARVYLPPGLGRPDGSLDEARLQDVKDHLAILARCGVTNFMVNMWSPPPHMKTPDRVRYGKFQDRVQRLEATFADGSRDELAEYIVAVLKRLREAGLPPPVGVSIQNEPDIAQNYDGCVYADTPDARAVYLQVLKQLRKGLDAEKFNAVPILATESSGAANLEAFFGAATTNGFTGLLADRDLDAAVGGFAWHQYHTVDHVRSFRAAMRAHDRPRWMTEVAQDATPMRGEEFPPTDDEGLKVTINMLRRMAADFTDFRVNYWFFWRGWHSTGGKSYPAQDLVFGDERRAQLSKLGLVLQRVWTTVRPGWLVLAARSSDPEFRTDNELMIGGYEPNGNMMSRGTDIIAFADADTGRQLILLINRWKDSKTITRLGGLTGSRGLAQVTTAAADLNPQPPRSIEKGVLTGGPLVLPGLSVTLIKTEK